VGVPRHQSLVIVIREVVREEVRHPIEPPRAATGSAPLRATESGDSGASVRPTRGLTKMGSREMGPGRSRPMTSVPIARGPVSG
jgi:hypothetical protein